MRTVLAAAVLTAASAAAPLPSYAEPIGCRAVAVPPRADRGAVRGDGVVSCDSPRGQVTVEVCVDAFAYFAGWLGLGCTSTTATGSVSLVVGTVTVCDEPNFPLMRTLVAAWTDRGEWLYDESVLTTATCGGGS